MSTPPHDIDTEKAVLGAMLLHPALSCNKVFSIISRDEAFYYNPHKLIFTCIKNLYSKNLSIDIITAGDELRRKGALEQVGSMAYLSQLTSEMTSPAHIESHCRILVEYAMRRAIAGELGNLIARSYSSENDVFTLLDESSQALYRLHIGLVKRGYDHLQGAANDVLKQIYARLKGENRGISGLTTGFRDIDNLTAGLHPKNFIVIAARPSMGKSAFMMSMARAQAAAGIPVGVFSLEMSKEELALRLLCSEARVNMHNVRTGYLRESDYGKLATYLGAVERYPIFVDDSSIISPLDLRANARRMVEEHGVQIVYIDYLQLMHVPGNRDGREREIAMISSSMKSLAKDLQIPVVALSQLNRNVEIRGGVKGGGKPMLSDLRESGSIEQDADVVMFVHRNRDTDCPPEEQGIASIIIGKQRNGPTGEVLIGWNGNCARFDDLEMRFPGEAAPSHNEPKEVQSEIVDW